MSLLSVQTHWFQLVLHQDLTSHISIPFPSGAPWLASFHQGCVDQWAAQGFDYTVTGKN